MTPRTETNYIVVHCSATRADQTVTVDDIRHWHVDERGWSDIGYHWIIDRYGKLHSGRDARVSGAHVRGHNHHSIAVCLIGGLSDDGQPQNNFTSYQMLTFEMLIEVLQLRYPQALVVGHNDLDSDKDCPSFVVSDWLESVL